MNGSAVYWLTGTLVAALLASPSVAHEPNVQSLDGGII
jgi:hypothetical protein